MNVLQHIRSRFAGPLSEQVDDPAELMTMIRPAQDPRFGDYQANCAMPLSKKLGRPTREVAQELVNGAVLDDFCASAEVAGPGFINIGLDNRWLGQQLAAALADERLGVSQATEPLTYVIDFSSPNVAKPMHVGHIRSTVIGDSLSRILRFLGHHVITDNHLGDWGTQFGMIIYGYKHFLDRKHYHENPIAELSRLYRHVRQIIDYQQAFVDLPKVTESLQNHCQRLRELEQAAETGNKDADKKTKKLLKGVRAKIKEETDRANKLTELIEQVQTDEARFRDATEHPSINQRVLEETAKLHDGDETNLALWREFLPYGRADMERIYKRLDIEFDHEFGESFYQDQLGDVVSDFRNSEVARESDGAICIFLPQYDAPMIIQKSDGAFLYATTDLATIRYRMQHWSPDVILYVVDFRQHEHFAKLFDVARAWKYADVDYQHVSFGTVMGDAGKPFQTRSGDTVGLESLLDEAEERAYQVVSELNANKTDDTALDDTELRQIAKVVGIGALKYADLSQNRSTDYTFSYDKMLQLTGNTATYLQYGYARVNGILRRGQIDPQSIRQEAGEFILQKDIERQLAVKLLRFEETLCEVIIDYRPNLLANYLFDLTQTFFVFFEKCPVLKAEDPELGKSRVQLCDLTARTIKQGLALMGISVVQRM